MNNVYLSKSKYCRAKQCNKMLWLDKNMPEAFEQTASDEILKNGSKVRRTCKRVIWRICQCRI